MDRNVDILMRYSDVCKDCLCRARPEGSFIFLDFAELKFESSLDELQTKRHYRTKLRTLTSLFSVIW
jgi:hypothetical protein